MRYQKLNNFNTIFNPKREYCKIFSTGREKKKCFLSPTSKTKWKFAYLSLKITSISRYGKIKK